MRMKTGLVATVVVVTAVACGREPAGEAHPAAPPVAVRVVTVGASAVDGYVEAGGVVAARTTAAVAARLLAPVREVRVAAGDRVRAGQVLVVLDGADVVAAAAAARAGATAAAEGQRAAAAEDAAAEAALALATATHGRIAALHAKRSATAQELDEATAALRAAEGRRQAAAARLQQARAGEAGAAAASDGAAATAGYLEIVAPFAGVVTEKLVEVGAMAAPGVPLLRLEDTSAFRAEVTVDEARVADVAPGTAVTVVFDGAEAAPIAATVAEVSRAVDADARAFLVKVPLPARDGVRSGSFVRVRFPVPARTALTVPADAVVRQGQVTSVFVVEDGVARLRLVRLRGAEVLAGLAAGDVVVTAPPPGLTDGRPVTAGGSR